MSLDKETFEHIDHAGSSSSDREAGFDEVYEKKLVCEPSKNSRLNIADAVIQSQGGLASTPNAGCTILCGTNRPYQRMINDDKGEQNKDAFANDVVIQMSNAAVAGMDKDLELVGTNRYSIALMIFFIPVSSHKFASYIATQVEYILIIFKCSTLSSSCPVIFCSAR
jgi:hypothetical protein